MTGAGFLVVLPGRQSPCHQFWHRPARARRLFDSAFNLYTLGIGAETIVLMVVLRQLARGYLLQMEMLLADRSDRVAARSWRRTRNYGDAQSRPLRL